jgi:integrase
MARNIRSSALESRSARLKLAKRGKPYWVRIDRGLALGYRRLETGGRWIIRRATGDGANWTKGFATADDYEESNNDSVLSFFQAQSTARTIARDGEASGGLITVTGAIDRYADDLAVRGGEARNARTARVHLPPALLSKPVSLLTQRELRSWRDGLLKGRAPATVNRIIVCVSAALELASSLDPITNRTAWKVGLRKLTGADTGRERNVVLPEEKIRELVSLAYEEDPAFGLFVETGAVTGARRVQLSRLRVADLQDNRPDPRVMMPSSRKGKKAKRVDRRPVAIPPSLAAKLRHAAGDRAPDELLLLKADGTAWGVNDPRRPFWRIVERTGLDPDVVTPNALRHSSITRQLLGSVPIRVVAAAHDTSIQMIEKTYAAYIADHSDTLFRRSLLDLGSPAEGNVVPLAKR